MRNPTNKDEYLDLLDQAIFETTDLLASAEDEGDDDDFARFVPVYERLEADLRKLHDDVRADLHPLPLAEKWKKHIPYYGLLESLNSTHKRVL